MFRSFSIISLRRLVSVFVVLICFTGAKAQEIEYVGHFFIGGEFRSVLVDGPYAYCALHGGFQILDISDPSAVTPVGDNPFIHFTYSRRLQLSEGYIYGISGSVNNSQLALAIIDIQNPDDPIITATLDFVGYRPMAVSGDYAYSIDPDAGIIIIDISDPYDPEVVGTYVNNNDNIDIFISGSYAYLSAREDGLEVLDISNPTEPVLLARYMSPTGIRIWEVFVVEPYAYITATEPDGYGLMIEIVDISDPLDPAYMGHVGFGGFGVGDIFVAGNYIYAFQEWYWDGALFIIVNVEDPENPYLEWSSEFSNGLSSLDLFVYGDRAYLTDDYSLTIMDISDPSAPTDLGGYTSKSGLHRIAGSGNYVYGTFEPLDGDLYIFGISDPTSPEFVAAYYVGGVTSDLTVVGDYVYVAAHGLKIVDVSIPESPLLVGEYETGAIRSVDVQGEYAYISVWASDMQIIDISDPHDPVLVGQCAVERPWGIFVRDDIAYVAQADEGLGLAVIDVSNPYEPVLLGSGGTPDRVYGGVYVQGQYAYVTLGSYGIDIIDISDPYNPNPIAYYDTPGFASDIYVNENFAYISDSWEGAIILDVSDPYNPAFVEVYDTPGAARSNCIDGEYIYVADDFSLMVLRFIGGPCDYIPGDCNRNGIPLEMSDVLAMIGNYRGTVAPYYICDCEVDPPGSHFAATADPNGNCVANELSDVVIEIGAYRGLAEASGCPDCPGSGG